MTSRWFIFSVVQVQKPTTAPMASIHHSRHSLLLSWMMFLLMGLFLLGDLSVVSAAAHRSSNNVQVNPLSTLARILRESRRDLVAAALARCASIFTLYPVDTVKTRLQMDQSNPFRLQNIYTGVAGSLVGQVPYGVLTFGSYELYKRALLARFGDDAQVPNALLYAAAAVFGDLTGSGWLCPSEVVKQQTQAGMYPSTGAAVRGIWKKRGPMGFYEGYFGGVTRDVPFRVAQLTTYEITKNFYLRIKARRNPGSARNKLALAPGESAICGAVAGTISAAVTAPLDRFKTLLMTDSAAYGGSVLSCAAKIWKEEGLRGMATGVVPRVTYIAPSVALFFIVYEQVQQRLDHWV